MKKQQTFTTILGIAVVTAFLALPSLTRADIWTEVGDAGQTLPSAQYTGLVGGNSLTTIFGTLGTSGDVDLYYINIATASTFSATTVNAITNTSGLDTQLYLFSQNGSAVYANDDDGGSGTLRSTLPAANLLGPLSPGFYYLAIATSGNEPVNFANTLLFTPDSPSFTIRGPATSVPGGLNGWDTTFADPGTGAYEIDLSGAFTAVPEPSTWLAAALSLGAIFFARRRRLSRGAVALALSLGLFASSSFATDVPDNLGNGLGELVRSNNLIKGGQTTGLFNGYATEQAEGYAQLAITDSDTGKVLVDIHLNGSASAGEVSDKLTDQLSSLEVTAVDAKYRGVGVIEGFISVDDVAALANNPAVSSVQLGLKPYHKGAKNKARKVPSLLSKLDKNQPSSGTINSVAPPLTQFGSFFDQGVTQHRVDKIDTLYNVAATHTYDGTGMSVGCISDSFDTAGNAGNTQATNIAAGDLPGAGNPVNTTPVADLQDFPGGSDEGRGMCQIVYKMAPKASIGFATADIGEVSFANNIRALAGMAGFTFPSQTFKADTVCDDVGYFDEPYYEDGVISDGIDDAVATGGPTGTGISYFSSAANDVDVNGYQSAIRSVPNGTGLTFAAGNTALINTNVNLAGVPTGLYAGGFHNFDPSGNPANQDVAQTVNVAANNTNPTTLQWDDPYDFNAGAVLGAQIYSNTGSFTATSTTATAIQFDNTSTPPLPPLTASQGYVLTEMATSGSYDAIVTIIDPSNTTIISQDTGVDETVRFVGTTTGNYKFQFGHFSTTTGNFSFVLNQATFTQYVQSNWNLLAFRVDTGAYVAASSLTANTLSTNQPIQLGYVNQTSSAIPAIQYVFARSNNPPGGANATHIRYLIPANGAGGYGPAEYFSYGSVTTSGHATAAGCNGMAAYGVFRPSIPEGFTSPGPATIYFDKNNNRLPTPLIRLQPTLAAADGANSNWFEVGDSASDGDSTGNFSGTSAAGPHAAAIGALVLQAHGGSGTVSPAKMTKILETTTFPHDLDPYLSTATTKTALGGKVTISVLSDNSANNGAIANNVSNTVGTGTNDPNAIVVSYTGPGFIQSVTFNPNGLASQGGCVTCGNNGVDSTNTYFSNVYPGLAFLPATKAFTVGNQSVGLTSTDVAATFTNLAPLPSNGTTQWWTMTLTFPNNNFTGGKALRFTVGRGPQHSSAVGTFANPLPTPTPSPGPTATPFAGPNSGTTTSNPHGDIWGGGVLIPEGTTTTAGMTVSILMSDNSTVTTTFANRIGAGWSNLDGYGFINAEAAVNAPLP